MVDKKLVFIVILLISIQFNLNGVNGEPKGYTYSLNYDTNLNSYFEPKEFKFDDSLNEEAKLQILFDDLFNKPDTQISIIPDGTRLIDLKFDNGHLNLYVSDEIKSYGGGSEWETALAKCILSTAFSIEEVTDVTLYISGIIDCLPEGTIIDKYERQTFFKTE